MAESNKQTEEIKTELLKYTESIDMERKANKLKTQRFLQRLSTLGFNHLRSAFS